jgi:hypothetical protein
VTVANQSACSSADRPLLLVDIDGVLNAFDAHRLTEDHRRTVVGGYLVTLDRRHPAWFDELAQYADICWATMWQAMAGPVFGRAAGLGTDWPYLDFDSAWTRSSRRRTGVGVGGYKWPLIEPLGDSDRPLLWIDDDMTDDQLRWSRARNAAGKPTMFVRPDPADGFTYDQYQQVLTFLHNNTGTVPAQGECSPMSPHRTCRTVHA